jgi:formyltetrahydrofolate-dependent phosphoribosylglycinamide formyltransferase
VGFGFSAAARRNPEMASRKQVSYKDAGVNIDEADRAVSLIKKHARPTFTQGVLTDIGSFGAGFQITGYKQAVLISSADGVGTKLKIAFLTGRHDTIGEDLVNHCTNDIAVQGAKPLFFLDYFAVGRLQADVAGQVIAGVARGCRRNNCALIGGETAEMPGLYQPGEYDLAGFIVGVVERRAMLTGGSIHAGDVLLGLPSNGLHTNGYSLARKLLFEVAGYKPTQKLPYDSKLTIADELLKVHASYLRPIRALLDANLLKGAAHITGGGITDNMPRILPKGLAAEVHSDTWHVPPHLRFVAGDRQRSSGRSPAHVQSGCGHDPGDLEAEPHEGRRYSGSSRREILRDRRHCGVAALARDLEMIRLGILISGRGSNFEAIAFHVKARKLDARIAVVISNRADARGLEKARANGIPAICIPSQGVPREEYDRKLVAELKAHDVELVCLAGYMRLLSPVFIREFPMRVLNIHPSLLPSFPGSGCAGAGAGTRRESERLHGSTSWMRIWTPAPSSCKPPCRYWTTTRRTLWRRGFFARSIASTARRLRCWRRATFAWKAAAWYAPLSRT